MARSSRRWLITGRRARPLRLDRLAGSCSRRPRLASSIQRTLMPLTGPLFKFALLQTAVNEFICSCAVIIS
ncbi:hypothetical protein I552_0119 [Mycobacterium xenopi 3993]|nr:hypothetical protein I552_0119 [Mycobacterium xenopi 3993]